jgi:XTP/dITP diphosphohydrolase
MMDMELVVATRNAGKLREISRLLAETEIRVLGLDDAFADLPEIEEDGETFEANARKKAETVARLTGRLTLADDSGLVVDALDGRPGVRSARFAGADATDEENNIKLLAELAGIPRERRGAAFHCAMALCSPVGDCLLFFGRVPGIVLDAPRGEEGFGYDPLFLVREYGKTMAELPMDVKNRISHRGQALRQAVDHLLAHR